EPADHHALDDVVHFTERRCGSLPLQDFEEIAVVRLSSRVSAFDGPRDSFANRSAPVALSVLPCEAVLRPRRPADALPILIDVVPAPRLEGVFMLRFDVAAADLDRVELVAADATIEHLPATGVRIKRPRRSVLHDRNRKRPVVGTNDQRGTPRRLRI